MPVESLGYSSSPDALLDAEAVAGLLRLNARWVKEAGASGLLPSVKLGRFRRYRRSDVLAFIEKQAQGG